MPGAEQEFANWVKSLTPEKRDEMAKSIARGFAQAGRKEFSELQRRLKKKDK